MTANEQKFSFQMKFDSLFDFSAPEYDDRHISYLLTEAQWRVFIRRYNPFADKYQKGFEGDEQRRRDLEQLIRSVIVDGQVLSDSLKFVGDTQIGSTLIEFVPDPVDESKPMTWGLYPGQPIDIHGNDPEDQYTAVDTKIISIVDDFKIKISKPLIKAVPSSPSPLTGVNIGLGYSSSQGGIHQNGIFLDLPIGFLYAIEEGAKLSTLTRESWVKPVKHDEYLANINNPYKKPHKNVVWRMDISRQAFAEGTSAETNKRTELILPAAYNLEYYRVRYLAAPPAIVCNEFDETEQCHCILDETLHREIVDEAVAIAQAAVKKGDYQVGLNEQQRSQ